MKLLSKIFLGSLFFGCLAIAACGDDDADGPTTAELIGTALEGSWSVDAGQVNVGDLYDNMNLTFGSFTPGTGGSLTVSGIDPDLISDFGTQYNISGEPTNELGFTLNVGSNVEELTFSNGDIDSGTFTIRFTNDDGVAIGGGRVSGTNGIGEYTFTITKQ